MSQSTTADKEIIVLKKKLDSAIQARLELQKDLEVQSSTFVQFISKLSHTAKGTDAQLDNKLAKLRKLLAKSSSWQDVQDMLSEITQLLLKHSATKDRNITHLHEQFHQAGQLLQKIRNLPDSLRRELRTLISETKDTKDSVIQYISPLSQLIKLYQTALISKEKIKHDVSSKNQSNTSPETTSVDSSIIERFTAFLTNLNVSSSYQPKINKIKTELTSNISHKELLDDFLEVFEIINKDLIAERDTAKVFLSTLSKTLSSVQTAVQTTISINEASKSKHSELNKKLKKNITDMAEGLNNANSLADVKVDINEKLKHIASALEEKTVFEFEQLKAMSLRLGEMQQKVNLLESQGRAFKKKIQEQQAISYQDALTKLGNRAAFDDYFSKQMVRFHHAPFDLAIVVLDLDNFKRINDTYGHTAGDKTLQVIAATLAKSIDKDQFVARYGGEEFVMIFTNIDKKQLIEKLNTIRLKVAKLPFKFKNNNVSITLSLGVTHVIGSDNIHTAFERADTALYKAKETGKNQVIYA
ncbi:GGDEF domain-containing protein [Thalassotalea piscium]|uniref:diguanylate cyclase n=1 Tax=Thalassotalea piscium TaxID=1230533 RepID=A0A7X0NIM9_9GAMM|nr:GGDEF domain-containing protein [Thalassotalea piscium]MBB6544120.1 diguanylate cyclase (GGDEF)-like protein [Thalassotalea piscium]